jgi:hypothetical protein
MNIMVITKSIVCMIVFLLMGVCFVPNLQGSSEKINESSSLLQSDRRVPCDNITVPDCVEVGDLLLLDLPWVEFIYYRIPGPYNDHGAIYVGNNTFVDAVVPVVKSRDYSHFYSLQKNYVFLRVKTANESQRQAAAAWAASKVGSPYQHFFRPPWFGLKMANTNLSLPIAHKFYCMELLWAAYYHQGIDIDQNGWSFPWWVPGDDILNDDDVEIIYRNVANSTEITKPFKGIYVANTKRMSTLEKTIVLGEITIEVETYNENVTRMDFFIDDVFMAAVTLPPFQWTWSEQASGRKVIKAIASDDQGNHYATSVIVWKIF